MSGGSTTSTRRGAGSSAAARAASAAAAAAAAAGSGASVPPEAGSSAAPASKAKAAAAGRQSSPQQEQQAQTQPAAAIPAATLQRLGIVGMGAGGSSTTGPHSTPSSPHSPVPSTPSSSSPPPFEQQLLLADHAGNPTSLVTLKAQLEHARETAALRSETVANYRAHLLAAPAPVLRASSTRRASSTASTSTSSRRNNGPSTSKLSPPPPTPSGPAPSVPSTSTLPAPSSTSRSRQPTPLHASNLSTNNAINALPATSSSLAAPRGTKRTRADSASDSSLSPQSATSNSSIEPLAAKQNKDTSSHHINGTTSRQGSPTSTSASGNALGLSSARLSRTAASSSQSHQSKDSNVGNSKDVTAAASPALSSSTSSSAAAAPGSKDAAPAAKPPGSKDALAAIAGLGAPLPSLPGFTRKKKQQPQEKQASPAPVARQASPPTDHPQHPSTSASSSSTSRLPPPPSSLPPRPPSLPPKPSTSYGSSTSHYRRESSTTGSTSGWERDRDNRDARDRDNTSRRGSERDTRDTDRERERERERVRERDRDKDRERERERDRDRDRDRDTRYRREGSTASTSRGRDSDTWLHNRSKDNSPVDEKRAAVPQDRQSPSTSTSMSNVSIGNASIPEVRIVEDTPSALPSPMHSTKAESPAPSEASWSESEAPQPKAPSKPPQILRYSKTLPKAADEVPPDQPPAPPEKDAPPPPPPLPADEAKSEQSDSKTEHVASNTTPQPTTEPSSQAPAPSRPRKTLPASTAAATAAVNNSPAAPSQKPVPPALVPRAAAIAADASAPVARPNTPLGRKTLPASVTAAASRRGSPAPSTLDKSKLSVTGGTGTQGAGTANAGAAINGQHRSSQLNSDGATADPEATALAKQKRKEEKKKRKLAALMDGGGGTPGTSPIQSNGQALPFPNGSPAIKINGLTPSASMTRTDSNAPTKMRRIDSATSLESSEKGGLKVKLGGITINRPKSLSPADGNQPANKKGPSVPGVADDFSLPTRSLVPAAPPLQIPTPTPSKQSEINEDLDNSKPATQVPYSSFANWYNDFLRSFGDDDLAFLAPKPEDSSIYDVPPLGPHYYETWATMDAELNGEQTDGPQPSIALLPPALRRFKSSNLSDADLAAENVYLGPLGERLVSAFRHTRDIQKVMEELFNSSQQNAIDLDKSGLDIEAPDSARAHPDGTVNKESQPIATDFANPLQTSPQFFSPAAFSDPAVLASTPSIKEMDAVDFESRLIRELSFLGVIPLPTRQALVMTKPSKKGADNALSALDLSSSVDWATRADDEISTALRACQRQLGKQSELNNKRKERLISIVRQRMAYQEYEHLRDGLEAVIEGAWAKRQRAAQRKAQKDRKDKDKKGDREKDKDKLEAASLAQSIAALNTPQPHSASLIAALTKRRSLLDNFRHLFPSNSYILPQESIYADLPKEANS